MPEIPRAAPAIIAYLKPQVPGARVSTVLNSVLPAVRVTLVYDYDAQEWERAPVFQIEVWADDEIVADTLANSLWNAWPGFRGVYANTTVMGAWRVSGPRPLPDTVSSKARVMFEGAFRIGES